MSSETRKTKLHPEQAKLPPARWPTHAEARASLLFRPTMIRALPVRTRTWVPAMVPWRASGDGFVTQDVLDWYGRFAEGRPGVLVVEATGIRDVPSGPLLRVGHERFVPGLAELVRTVREKSGGQTRLFLQIIDFLAIRRRPEREKYLRRFLTLRDEHREKLASLGEFDQRALDGGSKALSRGSDKELREALVELPHATLLEILNEREIEDLERGYRERVTDLQLPHVRELPQALPDLFANAALNARAAGFDGAELHYAHAYTMASFLSRLNDRSDGYGGSRENRVRLPLEVLHAVRRAVGDEFVVGCRMLGDEVIERGSRVDDACFFAAELARAGIDFLSISKGGKFEDAKQPKVGEAIYPYTGPSGLECMPTRKLDALGPFGRNLHLARDIRASVRASGATTPVVASGGISTFELAERALANGDADFIAAARQSLADPDWWRKLELGRGDEIRRCIYTNYCEALDQRHQQVTCQLWDHDFGADAVQRSHDGKRRLLPPRWDERAQ